jgi:hypothetical protein
MARKILDISVPLENDVAADPPGHGRLEHQATAAHVLKFFPGLKRLGHRVGSAIDALHDSSRCAMAFRFDHGSREAGHHHR